MTPRTATPPPRRSPLVRYGPLAVVLAGIVGLAALASTGRDEVATGTDPAAAIGAANDQLPITYDEAQRDGVLDEFDFGTGCDPATGRVKVPSVYAPPCVAARPGVEGGATYQGVTEDEITIVVYESSDDDLSAALSSTLDPREAAVDTRNKLLAMLEERFEMWGRRLRIVELKGSGSDETSARADAVKVASEIKAFASVGGPGQESAYAEELARRKVLCIGCGVSLPDSALQENAPYLWSNLQSPEQYLLNLGDFIIERLLGEPAEFAGDPELQETERVFGVVHFEQDPPVFGGVNELVERNGGERGYQAAVTLTYQLVIADLPEKARVIVGQLKDAGVTSVIFLGDPIMPIYLTEAATSQGYFPEWIITGTVLTDTTVFGRRYDPQQWGNAFGVSSLPARVPPDQGEAWRLHQWFHGEPPAATGTVAVIYEPLRILMLGLHMAGPNLTPETFRDGLFAYPPSGGTATAPRISWGDRGVFALPDYTAVDDMQVIWFDAEATGVDEQGAEGSGMMTYADGGKRYLPGEMPSTPANVFDPEGAVTIYDEIPAESRPPSYPSP